MAWCTLGYISSYGIVCIVSLAYLLLYILYPYILVSNIIRNIEQKQLNAILHKDLDTILVGDYARHLLNTQQLYSDCTPQTIRFKLF